MTFNYWIQNPSSISWTYFICISSVTLVQCGLLLINAERERAQIRNMFQQTTFTQNTINMPVFLSG